MIVFLLFFFHVMKKWMLTVHLVDMVKFFLKIKAAPNYLLISSKSIIPSI